MNEFVLDCSATLPWVFSSEATKETHVLHEVLIDGGKAWVPALWHLELGNVLLHARRRERIDQAGIAKFLSTLALYDIEVDDETITAAWSRTLALAETYGLTVYDGAYLELALRKGLPLASLDDPLRKALKKAGGSLVF